ncbi:MAG: hypothetical protein IJJ22_03900, partial [Oscillospiraceae bacterium]|nr:hypothetical protein [Oscillospiraceae bacterium]
MTLLITVFAAIITTVKWYTRKDDSMQLGMLLFLFWGASLMWLGDAIFGYAEEHAAFFTPAPLDMLNDAYLGLSVIALALVIWLVRLLITDPKGVVKSSMIRSAKTDKERKV